MELQTADAAARCGATDAPDGAGRQVFPDCGQRLDPCGAALMSGDEMCIRDSVPALQNVTKYPKKFL